MDKYLVTEKLTVGYDNKPLINDISLSLKRGEVLTLVGPNGSGKSTILKSITKHLAKISGEILVCGESLEKLDGISRAKKMSVVLTERIKPELMSCFEVVASSRYPYTNSFGKLTDGDIAIVEESLTLVSAESIKNRDFNSISDGQRQRILLARAICQQPEIMILDEPTSYLDIKHKIEILNILRDMAKKKNIAVIMSLHEIDFAAKISDYIAFVKGDHIETVGTPEEVFVGDKINELYDLKVGSYNIEFGSVELAKPMGQVNTFVLAGGKSGINAYRFLQKNNIAFATGVLWQGDSGYEVAKMLASDVVSVAHYSELTEKHLEEAKKIIDVCDNFVMTDLPIGTFNKRVLELVEYATLKGKKIVDDVKQLL